MPKQIILPPQLPSSGGVEERNCLEEIVIESFISLQINQVDGNEPQGNIGLKQLDLFVVFCAVLDLSYLSIGNWIQIKTMGLKEFEIDLEKQCIPTSVSKRYTSTHSQRLLSDLPSAIELAGHLSQETGLSSHGGSRLLVRCVVC